MADRLDGAFFILISGLVSYNPLIKLDGRWDLLLAQFAWKVRDPGESTETVIAGHPSA